MSFWTFLASLFWLLAVALGYFVCFPSHLLSLHRVLTGEDAAQDLEAQRSDFMRLTRRFCAVPMAICVVIALIFGRVASEAARTSQMTEQHDKERLERIRKQGVGSVYSKSWQNSPGQTALPGSEKKP